MVAVAEQNELITEPALRFAVTSAEGLSCSLTTSCGEESHYYYGVRYLDPVSARWMSTDPGLLDYLPATPTSDAVRKQNLVLPGDGGVFNLLNLGVYTYAANNPVKYVDPKGKEDSPSDLLIQNPMAYVNNEVNSELHAIGQGFKDMAIGLLSGQHNTPAQDYYAKIGLAASFIGLLIPGADVAAAARLEVGESSALTGELYHYTSSSAVASILENGLVPGRTSGLVFATPNGSLSPLQAQIELALSPNRGLPSALLKIDPSVLNEMGIRPVLGPSPVPNTMTAPGGGVEYAFNRAIPPEAISQVPLIPKVPED